jgi:hypothetical protein
MNPVTNPNLVPSHTYHVTTCSCERFYVCTRLHGVACQKIVTCDSREQLKSGSFLMSVAASMVLNVVLLGCACCGVVSSLLLIYGIYRVSGHTLPKGGYT